MYYCSTKSWKRALFRRTNKKQKPLLSKMGSFTVCSLIIPIHNSWILGVLYLKWLDSPRSRWQWSHKVSYTSQCGPYPCGFYPWLKAPLTLSCLFFQVQIKSYVHACMFTGLLGLMASWGPSTYTMNTFMWLVLAWIRQVSHNHSHKSERNQTFSV